MNKTVDESTGVVPKQRREAAVAGELKRRRANCTVR